MKYTYNYMTAEGTHVRPAYETNNLRDARKAARRMAQGNCLAGSRASWTVWQGGDIVASGSVRN